MSTGSSRGGPAGGTRPMPTQVPTGVPALRFPCPGCGKRLWCRAEWSGRKVQCSCGQVVLAPTPVWRQLLPPLVLALVLATTFCLKLRNLDHTALTRWDEAYHAVVARNV